MVTDERVLKKESKKNWFPLLVLTLIFFSSTCLYSMENRGIYIIIILAITFIVGFSCLISPKNIENLLNQGFTWWILFMFAMYTFYGVVLTVYNEYNWDYMLFILLIVLDVMIVFGQMSSKEVNDVFTKACAIASVLIAIYLISNEWGNILSGMIRIGDSASGNVNTVGVSLGIFSLPIIYKVINERKIVYLCIYVLQVIFMLMTGSKKALIFIIIGIGILTIIKNKFRIHRYILPILISGLIILVILKNEYFYNIIGFRVVDFLGTLGFNISNAHDSYSTELRMKMYKIGWELFKQKPFFGSGWFYFGVYSGLGTYTHNNFMEMLVTYGIMGFTMYYSMFLYVLNKLVRIVKYKKSLILYIVLICMMIINDTAAVSFSMNPINYIVLYMAFIISKMKND